jgi:hypothetical protein
MVFSEFVTLIDEVLYAAVCGLGWSRSLVSFDQAAQLKDFRAVVAEIVYQAPLESIGDIVNRRSNGAAKSISLDEFDGAVRQFLKALELAGVALPTDAVDVIDLFKKK